MKTLPETPTAFPVPPVRRHRWRRIAFALLAVVLLGGGAAGAFFYRYASKSLEKGGRKLPSIDAVDPGGAQNILIVGSDTREGLNKKEQADPAFYRTSGKRSDTIILIHLFGDKKHALVLSFPRDLRVHVPGFGLTKINAAYNLGADNVVKTVKEYSGLPINHYIEVNFVSFRRIVDQLGGVDMCVKHPYNDPDAGLFIKQTGCYHFDGSMALAFARTRKQDARGDFDRIDHQQQLIRVMLQKATSLRILTQPWKIVGISKAVGDSLVHDKDFDLPLAYGLAKRLKTGEGVDPHRVEFRQVPSDPKYIGGISFVIAREAESKALFDAIRADRWPLPDYGTTSASIPEPKDVSVRVYDASGDPSLARAIREKLAKLGFDAKIKILPAPSVLAKTEIWFRPGDDLKAKLVDDALAIGVVRSGDRADPDADVTVYVGRDGASEATASPSG